MTIAVDWDIKNQTNKNVHYLSFSLWFATWFGWWGLSLKADWSRSALQGNLNVSSERKTKHFLTPNLLGPGRGSLVSSILLNILKSIPYPWKLMSKYDQNYTHIQKALYHHIPKMLWIYTKVSHISKHLANIPVSLKTLPGPHLCNICNCILCLLLISRAPTAYSDSENISNIEMTYRARCLREQSSGFAQAWKVLEHPWK